MPLLSIIIPCYNAEKYIDNCFQSLENQTIGIKNLEIIFVNDASTDNTLKHLMDFEQKHPENVLVVNCEKNGRQGAARNIGLSYATSEYIGFADDDDAFEPEMYEDLYEKAISYDCDMVMCDSDTITGSDSLQQSQTEIPANDSSETDELYEIATPEERIAFITMDPVRCIWNKIYRKSILTTNSIHFPEGYIYDDIYFYELVKLYVKRIYKRNCVYYHHIFRQSSASIDTKRKNEMPGYLNVQLILLDELKKRGFYDLYKNSYNEMLLLEAIGLVKTYLIRYGKIEDTILLDVKNKLLPYRDEFLNNPLLQSIWHTGMVDIDRKIAKTLIL